eukprot:747460-Pyramimonas_sp.AAC.1
MRIRYGGGVGGTQVCPGAKIPTDGVVVHGSTHVDESHVTGESYPVLKSAGDKVTGGTMNCEGACLMRATRVGADTSLSQIVKLVENAQMAKVQTRATLFDTAVYV